MTEIADNMNIETVTVGAYEVNCYVVWDQVRNALVIDPGANPERVEKVIKANRLTVAAFLITHGHADHIGALSALHSSHPAPVALSAEDARWAFLPMNQLLPHYPALTSPPNVERVLADGQIPRPSAGKRERFPQSPRPKAIISNVLKIRCVSEALSEGSSRKEVSNPPRPGEDNPVLLPAPWPQTKGNPSRRVASCKEIP